MSDPTINNFNIPPKVTTPPKNKGDVQNTPAPDVAFQGSETVTNNTTSPRTEISKSASEALRNVFLANRNLELAKLAAVGAPNVDPTSFFHPSTLQGLQQLANMPQMVRKQINDEGIFGKLPQNELEAFAGDVENTLFGYTGTV